MVDSITRASLKTSVPEAATAAIEVTPKPSKRTGRRASASTPNPETIAPTTEEDVSNSTPALKVISIAVDDTSSSLKRKADEDSESKTATLGNGEGQNKPPAKKRKKADPVPKKPKAATTRATKTATPRVPRAKELTNAAHQLETIDLTPDPPAEISLALWHKIQQVKFDLAQNHLSVLERNAENANLITIPGSQVIGAIMNMRVHYQIGRQYDAKYDDLVEAIVDIFQRPIGMNPTPIDWFVVDVSKPTAFEDVIKRKIANHGLEGVSLFEAECEWIQRQLLADPMLKGFRLAPDWVRVDQPASPVPEVGQEVDVVAQDIMDWMEGSNVAGIKSGVGLRNGDGLVLKPVMAVLETCDGNEREEENKAVTPAEGSIRPASSKDAAMSGHDSIARHDSGVISGSDEVK